MIRVTIETDNLEYPVVIADGHVSISQNQLDFDTYTFVHQLLAIVINYASYVAKQQSVHQVEGNENVN